MLPKTADLIYENGLADCGDIEGFAMEGPGLATFPMGRMRLESSLAPSLEQKANLTFWCPQVFADNILIQWQFYPLVEPGLAIMFFSASGRNGESVLDPSLRPRTGEYDLYHHGDINALHVSYFRRSNPAEHHFQTCNLRKSHGFFLVAQGADPLPCVAQALPPYRIAIAKQGPRVRFYINELLLFDWRDTGEAGGQDTGPILAGGQIGFRQRSPMIAEYANLTVHALPAQEA